MTVRYYIESTDNDGIGGINTYDADLGTYNNMFWTHYWNRTEEGYRVKAGRIEGVTKIPMTLKQLQGDSL